MDLTKEELCEALKSHVFLKEKQDQTVEGQGGGGSNNQHGKIDMLDASSPTATLESVLLTAAIDPHEGPDVAAANIPDAFIQTQLKDNKDEATMHLHGKLAKLMVKVAPETRTKCVIVNRKGKTVPCIRLLDACCVAV
jgi:hypothetical protein